MNDRLRSMGALVQRRPWLFYAIAAALAYPISEMLVAGESATQFAHDVFDDDVPRLFSIAADWKAFGPSLWDPHLTSGNALLAQFALPPTAPDVLLSFVMPPFAAFAINSALMAFAAGLAMHLFLRDSLRLSPVACFAGGIIAALAFWQYILGYAALLLPLVLWTTDRVVSAEPGQRRRWFAAIAVVLFLLLSSLLQIVVLDGFVALIYVLAITGINRWRRGVGRLAAVWIAATLLAAPVVATVVFAVPASQRTIWDLPGVTIGQGIGDLAHRYAEIVLGVRTVGTFGGSADIYGSFFPGAVALPFLAVSLVVPRPTARLRFALMLLLAIPFLDLAASVAAGPLQHVSLIGSFQFVRVRHFVPIVVAMNVAIGISWATSPMALASLSVRRRAAALGLAGVALGALAYQAVIALRHAVRPPSSPVQAAGWELAAAALIGGTIVVGAILIVLLRSGRTGTGRRITIAGAIGVVLLTGLIGERFIFSRAERDLDGSLGTWSASVAPTAAEAFIAAQEAPGRVLSIGAHPNDLLASGLNMVDGYQTIYPLRYHELFGALTAPHLDADPVIYRYYHAWGNRAYAFGPEIRRPLANLLGIRWLYVAGPSLDDPSLSRAFSDGTITVYENPDAFPRAFIVHAVTVAADRSTLVATLERASTEDLRSHAYIASADAEGTADLTATAVSRGAAARTDAADPAATADAATITTDNPDDVIVKTHAGSAGILVLADTFADGWTASIDGRAAPILPVDDALRGVVMPAGEHTIRFAYRPLVTYAGLAAAGLTALLLAFWGLGVHGGLRRRTPLVR